VRDTGSALRETSTNPVQRRPVAAPSTRRRAATLLASSTESTFRVGETSALSLSKPPAVDHTPAPFRMAMGGGLGTASMPASARSLRKMVQGLQGGASWPEISTRPGTSSFQCSGAVGAWDGFSRVRRVIGRLDPDPPDNRGT
jgi:hypothetical protein